LKIAFDTNIFIGRPGFIFPARAYLSSVVLTELVAGAQDRTRLKELESWRGYAERFDRFLVPSAED
jgi:predicted nucleic acid-binding protein